ncbi:MAG: hypothetical protein H0U79_04390 [Solirubrobacterales bacterium]|nr:hypothetical protein [Solirubrobacterales bacterium]
MEQTADGQVGEDRFERLAGRVQGALGELAGAAKEGLLAVSVGVGLSVLAELMSPKSTRSWARRASTTRTAARCATATRLAKSR